MNSRERNTSVREDSSQNQDGEVNEESSQAQYSSGTDFQSNYASAQTESIYGERTVSFYGRHEDENNTSNVLIESRGLPAENSRFPPTSTHHEVEISQSSLDPNAPVFMPGNIGVTVGGASSNGSASYRQDNPPVLGAVGGPAIPAQSTAREPSNSEETIKDWALPAHSWFYATEKFPKSPKGPYSSFMMCYWFTQRKFNKDTYMKRAVDVEFHTLQELVYVFQQVPFFPREGKYVSSMKVDFSLAFLEEAPESDDETKYNYNFIVGDAMTKLRYFRDGCVLVFEHARDCLAPASVESFRLDQLCHEAAHSFLRHVPITCRGLPTPGFKEDWAYDELTGYLSVQLMKYSMLNEFSNFTSTEVNRNKFNGYLRSALLTTEKEGVDIIKRQIAWKPIRTFLKTVMIKKLKMRFSEINLEDHEYLIRMLVLLTPDQYCKIRSMQ